MMKNKGSIRIFVMILSVVALTGCGNMPDMTEHENELVAEYAAGVLLRYSSDYDLRLMSEEEAAESDEEQMLAKKEEPSPSPEVTPSPIPESTKAPDMQVEVVSGGSVEVIQEVSLNELYRMTGVEVQYIKSEFVQRYTEPGVLIKADSGRTKLLVAFEVKNTSSHIKKPNLTNRQISYLLSVDGMEIAPEFSMLQNGGMNHLSTSLRPGEKETVLLIFDLDKSRTTASQLTLEITEEQKKVSLDLKK